MKLFIRIPLDTLSGIKAVTQNEIAEKAFPNSNWKCELGKEFQVMQSMKNA